MDNQFRYSVRESNKPSLSNTKSIEKEKHCRFEMNCSLFTFALENLSPLPRISKTDIIDAINLSGRILKGNRLFPSIFLLIQTT